MRKIIRSPEEQLVEKARLKAYRHEYYINNKPKAIAHATAYQKDNEDYWIKRKIWLKDVYIPPEPTVEQIEAHRLYCSQYYQDNKEEMKADRKTYYAENTEACIADHKKKTKKDIRDIKAKKNE